MSISTPDDKECYECPECNYTSGTYRGVKIHYGRVHDGSLKPTVECGWCGEEFHVKPKQLGRARFCSRSCQYAHRCGCERPSAAELKCLHWDEGLSLNQMADEYGVGGHQTIMGWMEQYDIPHRSNAEANRKLNAERDDYDEIVKAAHEETRRLAARGEHHFQTDNPERNGYGEGWTDEKRETVREKYDRRCQACGITGEECRERHGCRLDVHHITPWSQFDDPEKRNAVENLIPLCRACHRKWEGIPIRPEVI